MSETTSITELFEEAADDGLLSQVSLDILSNPDVGVAIMDGMGVEIEDVDASETLLLSILVDDSGSIRFAGNAQAVRDGCNIIVEALKKCTQANAILVQIRFLNGFVLDSFKAIDQATELTPKNYDPDKGTPLYDQAVRFFGTALAKSEEFKANGIPCRTISLIITDGADMHSVEYDEKGVRSIVEDMLRQENHIIAAMGIKDDDTDFEQVFKDMGIPDDWVITTKSDGSDIRAKLGFVSQSMANAAAGGQSFSQQSAAGLGGFGN